MFIIEKAVALTTALFGYTREMNAMKPLQSNRFFGVILLVVLMAVALSGCNHQQGTEKETTQAAPEETISEETTTEQEDSTAEMTEEETAEKTKAESMTNGEYVTIQNAACTFIESVTGIYAYGTNAECGSMQGMESTEKYIYVAKQMANTSAVIVQYDVENDSQRPLAYYDSLDAAEQTTLDCVAHCNDMTIYTDADTQMYLLTANNYHPESNKYPCECLTRFQLDEESGTMRLTGFFNLVVSGTKEYVGAASVRWLAATEEYNYFLVKKVDNFYWFKLEVGAAGGPQESPEEITCIKLFDLDNSAVTYVNEDGELEAATGIEDWTRQGMYYSAEEELIYVPMYNGTNKRENFILVYDVSGLLTIDALEAVTENRNMVLTPSTFSFHLGTVMWGNLEVESCVFRKNQGADGDLCLYFNANGSKEGIWKVNYTRGSVKPE